jgi:hypothetical protein
MSRPWQRKWRSLGRMTLGGVLLATIIGIGGMIVIGFTLAERSNGSAEAASAFGVYLQPADASISDPVDAGLVRQALEGRRFEVVDEAKDLETFVDSDHPQSIWIHASALPSVSAEWLRGQLKDGTVIVGIDMPPSELASVLSVDAGSTPDWNPPNASTFVVVGQALDVAYTNDVGEPATRSRFTRGNSVFDPEQPKPLVAAVDRVIDNVRETYGGSR